MMLWVIFALLTGGAVLSVLWPLRRAPATSDPRELDVAFYRAQTAEIDREAQRGTLGPTEAEAARVEAARRLMTATQQSVPTLDGRRVWPARVVALAALLLVPLGALALYWQVGAPNMPDEPLQARLDAPAKDMDLATAIAKIEQHLLKNPDDGRGWAVLAPIYARLQRYPDAERAYTNEIRLLGASADRYAALGEIQVYAAGGTVTAQAKQSFEAARKIDPKSPRAGFYLGLAAEQDGKKDQAVAIWRQLVSDSPPEAPWLPMLRERIADATGTPAEGGPAGPMAAAVRAMPAGQQQAMIHRMVDGLAQRLKANGNDIEGWLRLVRAYRVLNEADKAKVALGDARKTFASDPAATKRLDDLAHELGLES